MCYLNCSQLSAEGGESAAPICSGICPISGCDQVCKDRGFPNGGSCLGVPGKDPSCCCNP